MFKQNKINNNINKLKKAFMKFKSWANGNLRMNIKLVAVC